MPLFTTKPTDQAFERFMKHQPNYHMDAQEADQIQEELAKRNAKRPTSEKAKNSFWQVQREIRPLRPGGLRQMRGALPAGDLVSEG